VTTQPAPTPPRAERRPLVHEIHGDRRVDEYAWLRRREDPAVIAHLEAENAYTEAMTAHTAPLRDRLFTEIVARIQQTDTGAPTPSGPWLYYSRTEEGRQYPILCRRARHHAGATEEVILDQNSLAEGHDYLRVGDAEVSPDHRLLAYTVDRDGSEQYTVRVRDLATGRDLPDVIERAYYSLAWTSDNATLFYTRPDSAMRPWQVWRHRLGTAPESDALVLQEDDERYFASVARSRSGALILVTLESKVTTEVHLLRADAPDDALRVVEPRRQGH